MKVIYFFLGLLKGNVDLFGCQFAEINDVVIYEDVFDEEKNECYVLALRKGKKKAGVASKVFFSDESKEYIQDYLQSRQVQGEQFNENTPLFTTTAGERLSISEIQQMLKNTLRLH